MREGAAVDQGLDCGGERIGSGRMVGVKSEDWKIEESKMNIVKSGPSWMGAGERNEM